MSDQDELWIIHYVDDSESSPVTYDEMQQIAREHPGEILFTEPYHPEGGEVYE